MEPTLPPSSLFSNQIKTHSSLKYEAWGNTKWEGGRESIGKMMKNNKMLRHWKESQKLIERKQPKADRQPSSQRDNLSRSRISSALTIPFNKPCRSSSERSPIIHDFNFQNAKVFVCTSSDRQIDLNGRFCFQLRGLQVASKSNEKTSPAPVQVRNNVNEEL